MTKRIETYAEFWLFYLAEHSKSATKIIHVIGTVSAICIVIFSVIGQCWSCLWLAPLVGYACAWLSHFLIEKNRPATFRYPLWSFISDFRMAYLYLTGQLR